MPVRWTTLTVRHTGYVDPALRARKLERDIRLLRLDLEDRPNDPFVLFNLGAIANERRDWSGSLTYLRRSLSRSAPSDSITRKLFALIARSHQMLGDTGAALRACAEPAFDPHLADMARKCLRVRAAGLARPAEEPIVGVGVCRRKAA